MGVLLVGLKIKMAYFLKKGDQMLRMKIVMTKSFSSMIKTKMETQFMKRKGR